MGRLRQSFSWWCFENRGLATDELLAATAKIGYEGVDLVPEALWPDVVRHGLKVAAVMGHASIEDGLNRRENAARIEGELRSQHRQGAEVENSGSDLFFREPSWATDEEGAKLSAWRRWRGWPWLRLMQGGSCDRVAEQQGGPYWLSMLLQDGVWGTEVCRQADRPL